jgi:dihydroflavonol-4-reductase
MEKEIYLLTGAAGLLGSNVSRQLIEKGKSVRTLVLKGDPAAKYIPKEAEIVVGDILDISSLEEFFKVPEGVEVTVIHSASIVTVDPDFSQIVQDVNVKGTKNIIDQCLKHKVKKLVYISSTGAIPEMPKNQPIKEPEKFDPKVVVGFYSNTKAQASQLVLDAVKNQGLDASIVYPSGICGPNDYAYGPVSTFIIDYVKGNMPAGIAGSFNSVDVRDLADGVIACANKGRKGEGYIMGNSIVCMQEMFDIISRQAGCKRVTTILPIQVAKVLAFFGKIGTKINGKPSALTSFAIYNLARNNNFCFDKAKRELGYKVRPFEDTIRDEVRWLKEEGKI